MSINFHKAAAVWIISYYFLLFYIPIVRTALPSYACSSFPLSEYQGLQTLYDSTHGARDWIWQQNTTRYGIPWNFTNTASIPSHNPCLEHWQYLTCTVTSSNVCQIQTVTLNNRGLNGTLPMGFGSQFTEMTSLQIYFNFDLIGTIPSSMFLSGSAGGMTKLVTLNLYSNGFTGPIPMNTSTRPYALLQKLQIHDNFLTGSISPSLGNFTALQTLSMYGNLLTQQLPSSLSQLTQLLTFYINNNLLTGSIPLGYQAWSTIHVIRIDVNLFTSTSLFEVLPLWSKSLTSLSAKYNELAGTIPTHTFSNLTLATSLYFDANYLSGTLPPSITSLISIKTLAFRQNLFTGSIPALSNTASTSSLWPSLYYLYLYTNYFTGEILSTSLCHLPKLLDLDIHDNMFTGKLPQTCNTSPTFKLPLQYLYIHENDFTGSISSSFVTQLYNVKAILLGNNYFTNSLPSNIGTALFNVQKVEFGTNMFNGSLPQSLCKMMNVTELMVDHNLFSGTLPNCFNHLQKLQYFYADDNLHLFGALPSSLGEVTSLMHLRLAETNIAGTIPLSYGNLTNLVEFMCYNMLLSGSLPENVVCRWKQLQYFDLDRNYQMTGTLPSCLANFGSNILDFSIAYNEFTGTIPMSVISQWPNLQILLLGHNKFTGTLPDSAAIYSALPFVEYFWVENNYLSGSIPINLSKLTSLMYLFLSYNQFTNTIPQTLSHLNQTLLYLECLSNQLTGTFPNTLLGALTNLQMIGVTANQLTGTIGIEIFQLHNLQYLKLDANYWTSTLPSTVSPTTTTWPYLHDFEVASNLLTGTLPSYLLYLLQMQTMNVSDNIFTGPLNILYSTVSSTKLGIQNWQELQVFSCYSNRFTSTIPSGMFSNLPSLHVLLLSNNRLSGSLATLVNATVQQSLATVDVSSNYFSGNLPSEVFSLPSLQSFAAIKNCLTGSVPVKDIICESESHLTLQSLVLDGLYTASHCTQSDSWVLFDSSWNIDIKVDSCLFTDLPNLQILHLAGNGIVGTLPDDLQSLAKNLTDLSLSHNRLSGSIPLIFQEHAWSNFDVSFNRLSGTLSSDIYSFTPPDSSSNPSLSLDINRLSGSIPSVLIDVQSINILEGNIFSCAIDEGTDFVGGGNGGQHSSLPHHDQAKDSYSCGSNATNTVIYVWIGLVLLPVLFIAILLYCFHKSAVDDSSKTQAVEGVGVQIKAIVMVWYKYYSSSVTVPTDIPIFPGEDIITLMKGFAQTRSWLITVATLFSCVFLVLFPLLSLGYSTHSYEYAWTLSMSFLSGVVPTVVPMICVICLITLLYMRALRGKVWINIRFIFDELRRNHNSDVLRRKRFNSSTRKGIDSAASQTNSDHENGEPLTVVSDNEDWGSSLWWYTKVIAILLLNLAIVLTVNMSYVYALSTNMTAAAKQWLALSVSVYKIVWNRVLFELFQASNLLSTSSSSSLYGLFGRCMTWMSLFNSILAPCIAIAFVSPNCFYYSLWSNPPSVDTTYQVSLCYLDFIGNTSSYDCTDQHQVAHSTSFVPAYSYDFQCSSTLLTSFAEVFVIRFLFTSLGPVFVAVVTRGLHYCWSNHSESQWFVPPLLRPMATPQPDKDPALPKHILRADIRIIGLITDIAIVLTFGTIFPPIALIGAVSIGVQTILLQCFVGRILNLYFDEHKRQGYLQQWIHRMNEECLEATELLRTSLLSLSILIVIVWSFFLFDTLGDSNGAGAGLGVLIAIVLFPVLLEAIDRFIDYKRNNQLNVNEEGHRSVSSGFELSSVVSSSAIAVHSDHSDVNNSVEDTNQDITVQNPILYK